MYHGWADKTTKEEGGRKSDEYKGNNLKIHFVNKIIL